MRRIVSRVAATMERSKAIARNAKKGPKLGFAGCHWTDASMGNDGRPPSRLVTGRALQPVWQSVKLMDEGDTTPTSDRILDATLAVLGRAGPRRLSLSDVASAAGVSRPTLYRWFPSKEALLEAFGAYGAFQPRAGGRGIASID